MSVCNTPGVLTAGASGTVDICIADLADGSAPSLGVYDIELGFDPALVSFTGVAFGDPVLGNQLDLFGLGSFQMTTPGMGTLGLYELSFDLVDDLNAMQAAAFVLARLSFETLAAGDSLLTLSVNALGDALGNPLLNVVVQGALLAVSPLPSNTVPEPASVALLLTALLAGIAPRWQCLRPGRTVVSRKALRFVAKYEVVRSPD